MIFSPSPTVSPSHLFSRLLMACKSQNLPLSLETIWEGGWKSLALPCTVTFASWCLKGATRCLAVRNAQRGSASQVSRSRGEASKAGCHHATWDKHQSPDQSEARKALAPKIVRMQGQSLFLFKMVIFCSSWIFALISLKRHQVLASLGFWTTGACFSSLALGLAPSTFAAELKA